MLRIVSSESPAMLRPKPIIGFLAASFDDVYQNAVWRGASREARSLGADLVFFGGQRLSSPIGFEALDNIAFDLAAQGSMAGLIVLTNVIGTYLSAEEQLRFLGRFKRSLVMTIGAEFPGVPTVRVDASGGMSAIARHLVEVHHRSRFLFLAGPRGHLESEARKVEFLRSLSELGCPGGQVDIVYSDFTDEDGEVKIEGYLAASRPFDAIVSANDRMAYGALRALARHGIEVPRDVSVTGFDDMEDSRFTIPPLTTVRQPAYELGRLAVRSLAAKLGLIHPDRLTEPSVSFVLRESCGCRYSSDYEEPAAREANEGDEDEAELQEALRSGVKIMPLLSVILTREIREGRNPGRLRHCAFPQPIRTAALEAIAEGERRFLAAQRFAADRRVYVLSEIQASLVSSFRIEDILAQIARGTRELGISASWLSLFGAKDTVPPWSSLLLAVDSQGCRILAPYGLRFRTSELVPGGLPGKAGSYVCEPLRFGEDRLGYLICTDDSLDPHLYEALRDQVSSALKGAMLMASERDREKSLESAVRARTAELSAANTRLVEEMERRKSLERELLSVSNRILGQIGQDIHDNLCQDIAGLGLMAAILEGKLRQASQSEGDFAFLAAEEAGAIAREAGAQAAKAKDIARGLYPAELEAKGIVQAVERLVQGTTVRGGGKAVLEISRHFSVHEPEKALQLYRIVQEALANAARHSGASLVRVGLRMDRESVSVSVEDDGRGLSADSGEEGGMGLHILKYRAGVIGGELTIRSTSSGTSISCRIPR